MPPTGNGHRYGGGRSSILFFTFLYARDIKKEETRDRGGSRGSPFIDWSFIFFSSRSARRHGGRFYFGYAAARHRLRSSTASAYRQLMGGYMAAIRLFSPMRFALFSPVVCLLL